MKKIGIITLALVLALGSLGIGYAAWNKTMTITGTVAAGNLDVEFDEVVNFSGPDIGQGSAAKTGQYTGTITVANAYPGYSGTAIFRVNNIGTIPVLANITVEPITKNGGGALSDLTVAVTPTSSTAIGVTKSADFTITCTIKDVGNVAEGTVFTIPITIMAEQNP